MNILVVDDEYFALELMKRALVEVAPGENLYICQDVRGALRLAGENIIDVAFLDINMPEMNGIELALELKRIHPKINIIFATGYDTYMKQGIDLRMSGYLLKPIRTDDVRTELENLRNPIEWNREKRIKILTFGNFDVFVDGMPLKFERKQSKEILAYLVDKRGTSATYAELAAMLWEDEEYDRLFVINSKNLSTGIGLQVLRAAELRDSGKSAEEIVAEIEGARDKVRASFVIDTPTFLARGGRCTAVEAFMASALKIHPEILVKDGKMGAGKKVRGRPALAVSAYVDGLIPALENADTRRVFVTHSGCDREIIDSVKSRLSDLGIFEEILETQAGGVISSHCGPNTLGVLFYEK